MPVSRSTGYRAEYPIQKKIPTEHYETRHQLIQEPSWIGEADDRGRPEDQGNCGIGGPDDSDDERRHKAHTTCVEEPACTFPFHVIVIFAVAREFGDELVVKHGHISARRA
jgi:hypothetical protein